MKQYKLILRFKDKPECERCMLSDEQYYCLDSKPFRKCMAIGIRPACPEEGCRKDCPLVEESEVEE